MDNLWVAHFSSIRIIPNIVFWNEWEGKKKRYKSVKVLSFSVAIIPKTLLYPKHGIVINIYEKQRLP